MNTITNSNGELRSVSGEHGVEALRIRTIITGLRFEANTGMKMTRHVNLKKLAKETTGLRTNDVTRLIAALEIKMNEAVDKCEVVTV